jgi:hypothetical protein
VPDSAPMTHPGRTRLTQITGLLVVLALLGTACATGKQQPESAGTTPATGSGQFGTVPATATATATSTPTATATSTPTATATPTAGQTGGGSPTLILTLPPAVLLKPWPSPQDCNSYDPNTATIKYTSSQNLWQIVASGEALLAFKTSSDADQGLTLAKANGQECFVGRNDQAAPGDVMTYWLSPVSGAPTIASPDCIAYDPNQLSVAASGSRWLLKTPSEAIESFVSQADANNAKLVMTHYNRHCYIGRDYNGSDRAGYITEWFANA